MIYFLVCIKATNFNMRSFKVYPIRYDKQMTKHDMSYCISIEASIAPDCFYENILIAYKQDETLFLNMFIPK